MFDDNGSDDPPGDDAAPGAGVDPARAHEVRLKELEGELAEVVGVVNVAHGRMVELVGVALDEELWSGFGIHSPAHWLAWKTGLSARRAREVVRIAERARELPEAAAALVAGELSVDQASVIAEHVPAGFDHSVTEFAKIATVSQLRRTLPRYVYPEAGPSPEQGPVEGPLVAVESVVEEVREVTTGSDEDGWWLRARLPVDEGAVVERALRVARDDLYRQARTAEPDGDPPRVTSADGLLSLAEITLRTGQAAHPGSTRYLVNAHLEAGPGDDPTGFACLHLGPTLPGRLRRLLTCDGTIRPILEREGRPLSVGRATRVVGDALRTAIEHRDQGCTVPGCGQPALTAKEIHHIVHWEHGGSTDTGNLTTLCPRHHRDHHNGRLGIVGNADRPRHPRRPGDPPGPPDGLTFYDRWGNELTPNGTPNIPRRDQTPRQAATDRGLPDADYCHPLGERLQPDCLFFSPDPAPRPPESGPPESGPPAPGLTGCGPITSGPSGSGSIEVGPPESGPPGSGPAESGQPSGSGPAESGQPPGFGPPRSGPAEPGESPEPGPSR
jgi:hypothetical protein